MLKSPIRGDSPRFDGQIQPLDGYVQAGCTPHDITTTWYQPSDERRSQGPELPEVPIQVTPAPQRYKSIITPPRFPHD